MHFPLFKPWRQNRLQDAIDSGVIDLDETTHRLSRQIWTARDALLIQIGEARLTALPPAIEFLKPSQVDLFGLSLRRSLQTKDSSLLRSYVQLLIDEVILNDDDALMHWSYAALANVLQQMKTATNQLPTFMQDWCARRDSNPPPLASETNT
ncbi:MAG: hypothetical protein WA632_14160, partial [Gallionella sp.]